MFRQSWIIFYSIVFKLHNKSPETCINIGFPSFISRTNGVSFTCLVIIS